MIHGQPVVDADSHKCENPIVLLDYIERPFRDRIDFIRDRYGEQRFRILDRDPRTGRNELARVFLQPEGYGKGTYRPYHRESSLGGIFNRVRIEHMDREGIDHQVVYGSITLAFSSLIDRELGVALCRAYNDYIRDDCAPHRHRLHPVGVLPIQDPAEAVLELERCVESLGMVAVTAAPHVPMPHPAAPEAFPEVRVPKHLSHPDFEPLLERAEQLDVAIGLHGAPGVGLAGGASDQLDSFTLVHVFANRSLQQMALARLLFDGTFDAFPRLRFGFLEAGCGWLPDFMWSLHEHWEKRIAHFDPSVEVRPRDFLLELAREQRVGSRRMLGQARGFMRMLFSESEKEVSPEELERFRHEHPAIQSDPLSYLAEGRTFFSCEPGDPSPTLLREGLGPVGETLCGLAVDYGHWDAELGGCVAAIAENAAFSENFKERLLSRNARAFYGPRLEARLHPPKPAFERSVPERRGDRRNPAHFPSIP